MKNIFDHIEYVKGKPHHVKRRVAFGAAAGIAGLIGVIWLGVGLSTNAFAIQGTNFADSTGAAGAAPAAGAADGSAAGLAGAAAGLESGSANVPAHIEIIDAATTSAPSDTADQTVIPF